MTASVRGAVDVLRGKKELAIRSTAAVAVALGLAVSLAGCGGQTAKAASAATLPAASGSSVATPAPRQVGIPALVTTVAAPRATTAVPSRATKAASSTPVRTSAAGHSTVAAPKPAPAPVATPAPSVARSVHLTNEQCGPTGLTFDVVFSDGHVAQESSPPTGSISSIHLTDATPYNGVFSVTNPGISC